MLQGLGGAQTEGTVSSQELAQQILLEHIQEREKGISGAKGGRREAGVLPSLSVSMVLIPPWASLSLCVRGVMLSDALMLSVPL